MRKTFLLLLSLFLFAGGLFAQKRTVSGTIVDSKGDPVFAASITFKGYNRGTATGADGTFTITIPETVKTMVISGINIKSREVSVEGKTTLGTIALDNANKQLDEVVVAAYGNVKKTNLTGSVATVGGAQLADRPFSSPDKELQGAVAGVEVSSTSGQPGSSTDIRIRGIGSITASSSPLWVIDGVEANTGDYSENNTTSNILGTINPDDIESITILKDAAATAIYGSKGGNGVVLVTTKKGRVGKTRITFNTEIGSNSQAVSPGNKPLTSGQSQTLLREAVINSGYAATNSDADAFITGSNGFGLIPNYASVNTNWHDVITRNGAQQQYNLSLSGGDERTQVYASAGYFDQVGTAISSDFKRYNGTVSIKHKATDRLTIASSITMGYTLQHAPTNGGTFANPVLSSFFLLPWYTPYNTRGQLRYGPFDSLGEFPQAATLFNPVVIADYNSNVYRQVSVRGNVEANYKILNGLKFTSRYAGEYTDISEDVYRNPFYGDGFAQSTKSAGNGYADYERLYNWTWTNFLDWRQNLNHAQDVYFNLTAGYEAYEFNEYNLKTSGQGFPQTLALKYLASTATPLSASTVPTANATASQFALGNINYKDRYVLSGSFRRDASSVFGANHKAGIFYSVGGAWNITEEDFMKNSRILSTLKLRGSYGEAGNDLGFGFYTPLATYGYGYTYNGTPGSAPNNVGNPNLTWEKSAQADVAVDFGLFRDRITGTVDYYDKKTTNLLLAVPLSLTSGFPGGQLENIGGLSNKGIEFTVSAIPISTRDFTWKLNFNISHNKNRVTSLYQNSPVGSGYFDYTVGHDLRAYYMPQWAGVNSATGAPQWYTDASSKRAITGDYNDSAAYTLNDKYTASPKVFGSIGSTLTYKGISLDFSFFYNFGNYLLDQWGFINNSDGAFLGGYNQMQSQMTAWQKPGDHTNVPQLLVGGNANSNQLSTRYLFKGDYARLRNIQLSYSIPKHLLDKAHIASLSVYVRGTNLLTLFTDKGLPYDPESGVFTTNNLDVYIPKTIAGGIKLGF